MTLTNPSYRPFLDKYVTLWLAISYSGTQSGSNFIRNLVGSSSLITKGPLYLLRVFRIVKELSSISQLSHKTVFELNDGVM